MDNRPLLYCLDADVRRHVQDMTLEDAERQAASNAAIATDVDVVAGGYSHGYYLMCEKTPIDYACWISYPTGWTIGYRTGWTSSQAIERVLAACDGYNQGHCED